MTRAPRSLILPLLCVLAVACGAAGVACRTTEPPPSSLLKQWYAHLRDQAPACQDAARALDSSLSAEGVRLLLESCRPQSLDALAPLLPARLRSNTLLAYRSEGPDAAQVTLAAPRVILFSDTAKLILSYVSTAASELPSIEAMEFDFALDRFDLYRFEFASPIGPFARVSRNSSRCLECHGADPQPIWNSYAFWPGFYGSFDDTLITGSPRASSYDYFVSNVAPLHARYGALDLTQKQRASSPQKSSDSRLRPNLRFTQALRNLLALRGARILVDDPAIRSRPTGSPVETCPVKRPNFPSFREVRYLLREEIDLEESLLKEEAPSEGILPAPFRTVPLSSSAPEADYPFLAISSESTWLPLERELGAIPASLKFLAGKDRKVSYFELGSDLDQSIDCLTREAIVRRLSRPRVHEPSPSLAPSPAALLLRDRCAQCHGGAPERLGPFEDPAALRSQFARFPWLREDLLRRIRSREADRMPPEQPLTEDEIRQIEDWVR